MSLLDLAAPPLPDAQLEAVELRQIVDVLLAALPDDERRAVRYALGFCAYSAKTLSAERLRNLKYRALNRIRRCCRRTLYDAAIGVACSREVRAREYEDLCAAIVLEDARSVRLAVERSQRVARRAALARTLAEGRRQRLALRLNKILTRPV